MKLIDRLKFRGLKSVPYERIIFLHIMKTAGSGISNHIIKYLKTDKYMRWGDYHKVPQNDLYSYFYISGHFDFNYINNLLEDSYSFTFLRDPIERTISDYNFVLQLPINDNTKKIMPRIESVKQMSFEEFVDSEDSRIANFQARSMYKRNPPDETPEYNYYYDHRILEIAKENLRKLSYVGFVETFRKDFHNILTELKIPLPIRNKVVNKSHNKTDANSLSPATLAKLESKVQLDRKLYEYAWNNLRRI